MITRFINSNRDEGDRLELKLAKERGERIDIHAQVEKDKTMILVVRSKLLGLPSKLATRMGGRSDEQRLAYLQREFEEAHNEWQFEEV